MTTPDQVPQTDAAGARRLAAQGALLLDVREPDEWAAGHIDSAIHVPLGQLDPTRFDPSRPIVAICRSGNRSGQAAAALADAGIDAHNLAGGMKAWADAGQDVVDADGRPGTVA